MSEILPILDARYGLSPASAALAVFGDSRANQNASITYNPPSKLARGWAPMTEFLTRGRVRFDPRTHNFGVSGDSVQQANARLNTVLTSSASFVVLLVGTNSINALIDDSATVQAMAISIRDAGKIPIIIAEWPRTFASWSGSDPAKSAAMLLAYARKLKAMRSNRGMHIVDVWPELADPASVLAEPRLNFMNADGLHNSPTNAFLTARKIADIVNLYLPDPGYGPLSNGDVYDPVLNPKGALNSNPLLAGTAGSAPTDYTTSVSTGLTTTFTRSVVNGRDALHVNIAGTPSTSGPYFRLRQQIASSKLAPGDQIEAMMAIRIAAGHTGLISPATLADPNTSNLRAWGLVGYSDDTPLQISDGYGGVVFSSTYTVPETVPPSFYFEGRLQFRQSVAVSVDADIEWLSINKLG